MTKEATLPRHVQRDGASFRARVKHDGRAFSRSFDVQAKAEQFARALVFVLKGPDELGEPSKQTAAVHAPLLREVERFVAGVLGDAYMPGLNRSRWRTVCTNIRADGMRLDKTGRQPKGRGRFEVRVGLHGPFYFSTLEKALKRRQKLRALLKRPEPRPRPPRPGVRG